MNDIIDFIIKLIPISVILSILYILGQSFLVFAFSLSIVYLFGRMLGLVKTYRTKNIIAFFCMIISCIVVNWVFNYDMSFKFIEVSKDKIIFVLISVLILILAILEYVLIGFHLYDRFDNFLDRKFGKNKHRGKIK